MGTIQEALRELRKTRVVESNRKTSLKVTSKKKLKEELEAEKEEVVKEDVDLQDEIEGDGEEYYLEEDVNPVEDESLPDDETDTPEEELTPETKYYIVRGNEVLTLQFQDSGERPDPDLVDSPLFFETKEEAEQFANKYFEGDVEIHDITYNDNSLPENESLTEDANSLVDMDGDVEVTDFNLTDFNESCKEELTEAFNTSDIKKDPRFADLSDKLIRGLIRIMEADAFGDVDVTSEMFLQWVDDACNGGPLTPLALEAGAQLSANDFYELVKNDPKFMDVFTKVCEKINWTDKEGNALDSENKPLKSTSKYELITDFLNMADDKQHAIDILNDAYYNDDYSSLESKTESLDEDLASTLPVHALPENEVIDYINNIPVAKGIEKAEDGTVIAKARPTCFFKLGYFKQVEVASKFRGGRGSKPEDPNVKVFKAIEYSKLYTGADYENLKAVKQFRKETGTERSGEKTGFGYQGEGATVNKIGVYPNGDKALQSYLANNCKTKTKYYISINDGDVKEATREEVAQYLTPANANKLLNPEARPKTVEKSVNAESGEEIVTFNPQAVNRLKIANIYMIGNLGHSIM